MNSEIMIRYRVEKEGIRLVRHMGLHKLAHILSFLATFVAGVIAGLTANSHVNIYFNSQAKLFFASSFAASTIPADNCTIVKPCEKEIVDCFSMDTFLHPKNLTHNMNDEELFWRASLMPYKKGYPFPRVPKVAFMFLTRGPLPLLPLWERFFKNHEKLFSVYVHAPSGFVLNVTSDSPFYGRQIPSRTVRWGTMSLFDAEKRLLANALLDVSNERFVLLSESCIPVHNFRTVYKYLIDSDYSFAESYDDPSRYGRGRYSRKMLPEIRLHQWRKGSQWFEMQRTMAAYIVSDTKYYDIFKKYCLPACYPDEHYIPTYLNMHHGSHNANRTVTWVNWSMGGPHPATYGAANITESFIQSIRHNSTGCSYNSEKTSVCYLFARKFTSSSLEPLLNLTATVMEF